MSKPTYRSHWKQLFQRNRDSCVRVSSWDLFEGWEENRSPDSSAESELFSALTILYGGGDSDLAKQFLGRCLAVCKRAWDEDKPESPLCCERFPENRGTLLRTRAYAELLLDRPLDQATLLAASVDFQAACDQYDKHHWDQFIEANYLAAIRLALLGRSLSRVQKLFKHRRRFRTHLEEQDLLRHLATSLQPGSSPQPEDFQTRFDAFFHQVRNPLYDPDEYSRVAILQLELGLLRDMFLISPDGQIDWRRTIDAIAE